MNLHDIITFTDENDKTIGGGSVSAAVGSMCATIVRMVAELSKGKGCGLEDDEYDEIIGESENLAKQLQEGAVKDSVAYNKIVAAYRLPKGTKEEQKVRKEQVSQAGYFASRVPADNAIACNNVLKLARRLKGNSNAAAASDLFCACLFLADSTEGLIKNIEANLYLIKDESQKAELIEVVEDLRCLRCETKSMRVAANISEGRNSEGIDAIEKAILAADGVTMESVTPDPDHNRTVFIFKGEPEAVLSGAKQMANVALKLIDMENHHGSHPRMGAIDVVPFMPLGNATVEEAVNISRRFGKYLGSLGVPVYYYEDAATCPERRNLVDIRKGEYEGLKDKIESGCFVPDEGPNLFNPKSGATVTGCRFPLVALNVNLNTADIIIAKKIVGQLREAKGGYRNVRAIALEIPEKNEVQVSINLVQYEETPIHKVYETLKSEAAAYGVTVAGTELVGGLPLKAIEDVVRFYLQAHDFDIIRDCY